MALIGVQRIAVSAGAVALFDEAVAGVVNAHVGAGLLFGNLLGAGFAGVLVQYWRSPGEESARAMRVILAIPFLAAVLLVIAGLVTATMGRVGPSATMLVAGVTAGYVVSKHLAFVEGSIRRYVAFELLGAALFTTAFVGAWRLDRAELLYVAAITAMAPVFGLALRRAWAGAWVSPSIVPRRWVSYGSWVATATALGNSLGTLPVVILVASGEEAAGGVVAAVMGWLAPLLLLPRAFSLVFVPRIAALWNAGKGTEVREIVGEHGPFLELLAFSIQGVMFLGAWRLVGFLALSRQPTEAEALAILVGTLVVALQAGATPIANVLAGCERARQNAFATIVSFTWLAAIPLLGMTALGGLSALAAATATRYVLLYTFARDLIPGSVTMTLVLVPVVAATAITGVIWPPTALVLVGIVLTLRRQWLRMEVAVLRNAIRQRR